MAVYTLPDPSYGYAVLEPYISDTIMELHHDKHHTNCVGGVNAALEKLEVARGSGDFATVSLYEENLAFNLGSHTSHTVFWQSMAPDIQERPEGGLAAAIGEYLDPFEKFQGRFATVAPGL